MDIREFKEGMCMLGYHQVGWYIHPTNPQYHTHTISGIDGKKYQRADTHVIKDGTVLAWLAPHGYVRDCIYLSAIYSVREVLVLSIEEHTIASTDGIHLLARCRDLLTAAEYLIPLHWLHEEVVDAAD